MMNDGSKKIKNHAAPKIRRLLRPLRGLAMTASKITATAPYTNAVSRIIGRTGEKGDGSVFSDEKKFKKQNRPLFPQRLRLGCPFGKLG